MNYIGKYEIPLMEPVYDIPEAEWIGFNYALSTRNRSDYAVHFYLDDDQFERVWKNKERYPQLARKSIPTPKSRFWMDTTK